MSGREARAASATGRPFVLPGNPDIGKKINVYPCFRGFLIPIYGSLIILYNKRLPSPVDHT